MRKFYAARYTHARLLRVDASKAAKLPGVVAVLTRDDLKGMNSYFGPVVKDQPVVAIDRVRYVGDIIAAVAAEEKDIAEEAVELIEVEYEPLPPVFDPAEAMKPGAPILHGESARSETRLDRDHFRYQKNSNVLSIYHADQGDITVGFKEADEIFEDVYSSQKIQHAHIEPHAALAYWEPSGKLVIYTSTQNPSSIRAQLAELFNLPQSKVRVIVPYVGGGYGGKVHPRLEPLTSALARKAHRPVQWVLSREEVFLTAHCHASVVKIKTGVKRDGTHCRAPGGRLLRHRSLRTDRAVDDQKRRRSVWGAVSDSASGFDDILRVHEHAADGAVSGVWGTAGMLGV